MLRLCDPRVPVPEHKSEPSESCWTMLKRGGAIAAGYDLEVRHATGYGLLGSYYSDKTDPLQLAGCLRGTAHVMPDDVWYYLCQAARASRRDETYKGPIAISISPESELWSELAHGVVREAAQQPAAAHGALMRDMKPPFECKPLTRELSELHVVHNTTRCEQPSMATPTASPPVPALLGVWLGGEPQDWRALRDGARALLGDAGYAAVLPTLDLLVETREHAGEYMSAEQEARWRALAERGLGDALTGGAPRLRIALSVSGQPRELRIGSLGTGVYELNDYVPSTASERTRAVAANRAYGEILGVALYNAAR